MKSQICSIILLVATIVPVRTFGFGSVDEVNPLEVSATAAAAELSTETQSKTIEQMAKLTAASSAVAFFQSQIENYEKEYNHYMKDVGEYTQGLKACYNMYFECYDLMLGILAVKKAIDANPEGVFATGVMTNIYIETATELVSLFGILRNALSTPKQLGWTAGDEEATAPVLSMLSVKDRVSLLWTVEERISSLAKRFRELSTSIRMYNITDVWNRMTAGMYYRSQGTVARQSLDRWKRSGQLYDIYGTLNK